MSVENQLFADIMWKFDFPMIQHSDNGVEFKSKIMENLSQHKQGFNRYYSKTDNFILMQLLNLTSFMDNKLQDIYHDILEMKQMSIYRIKSTLTKLRAYPNNFWSSLKVKMFSTMDNLVSALGILALAIGCTANVFRIKWVVYISMLDQTPPNNDTHIELQPITNPMPEISDQLSPQLVQEILKASGVDMSKFEHYKKCKALHQTSAQCTELSEA